MRQCERRLAASFVKTYGDNCNGTARGLPHHPLCDAKKGKSGEDWGLTDNQWVLYKEAVQVLLMIELRGQRPQVMCECCRCNAGEWRD